MAAEGSSISVGGRGGGISRPAYAIPKSHSTPAAAFQDGSAGATARPTASVSRPGDGNKLRLTVKAPPSKLRQATLGSRHLSDSEDQSESDATPRPAQRSVRSTRNTRTLVDPDSDELDAMADEDDAAFDKMDEDEDEPELNNRDSDVDADGDDDVDEDEDMDELQDSPHPPAPTIRRDNKGKPYAAPPAAGRPLKSVEDKEMEDADDQDEDEDELSDLDSNDENGEIEDENEEDVDEDEEEDEEEEEEGQGGGNADASGSDDDGDNSGSATPDLNKLTKRQRGAFEEDVDASLLALSNEAQKKKHFTEEEHAVRRQEMARRRKNLSEKRNEEEKMETINKLLSKPAPKRRTRAEILAAQRAAEMGDTPGAEDGEQEPAHPVFARWTMNAHSSRVGIPTEWFHGSVGAVFARGPQDEDTIKVSRRSAPYTGALVQEFA